MPQIFAFLTATAVTFDDAEDSEEYSEEHGWIDLSWSRTELHESRNDVRPLMSCDEDDEDLREEIAGVFDSLPAGPYWDNGDGTFYGQGEDLTSGGTSYTYAVHFSRKWHAAPGLDGWREEPWHPLDGYRALTSTEADEWHAGRTSYADAVETAHGVMVRGA